MLDEANHHLNLDQPTAWIQDISACPLTQILIDRESITLEIQEHLTRPSCVPVLSVYA